MCTYSVGVGVNSARYSAVGLGFTVPCLKVFLVALERAKISQFTEPFSGVATLIAARVPPNVHTSCLDAALSRSGGDFKA